MNQTFADNHQVGFLKVPKDLDVVPVLSLPTRKFIAPRSIPLMDYCLPTDDQGNNPWCAAYAAAGFAENILWRVRNYPEQIDPEWIYKYAKSIDGDSNGDGTTLIAVLKALLWKGIFNEDKCRIKTIRNVEQIKFAIHKFGCCIAGFNISKEWYDCNERKTAIFGEGDNSLIGGHAVLVCGYMPDGLIIQNSWGEKWGNNGCAIMSWEEVNRQFLYGAVLNNCLYDIML